MEGIARLDKLNANRTRNHSQLKSQTVVERLKSTKTIRDHKYLKEHLNKNLFKELHRSTGLGKNKQKKKVERTVSL